VWFGKIFINYKYLIFISYSLTYEQQIFLLLFVSEQKKGNLINSENQDNNVKWAQSPFLIASGNQKFNYFGRDKNNKIMDTQLSMIIGVKFNTLGRKFYSIMR
jgi:hypothetical protein